MAENPGRKKPVIGLAGAALAGALLFSAANTAQAALEICNRSSDELSIGIIYEHYHTFGEPPTWPVKGWYRIPPNDCGYVLTDYRERKVFLSILKRRDKHKSWVVPLTVSSDFDMWQWGAQGIARKMCIDRDPIAGYRETLEAFSRCTGKGEYFQYFNAYVRVGENQDYTLSID